MREWFSDALAGLPTVLISLAVCGILLGATYWVAGSIGTAGLILAVLCVLCVLGISALVGQAKRHG